MKPGAANGTSPITPEAMLLHALILAQKPKVQAAMAAKLSEIVNCKVTQIHRGPSRAEVRDAAAEALEFYTQLRTGNAL
jgi:hypothetical protein